MAASDVPSPPMQGAGPVVRYKLTPGELTARITPTTDLFVLAHVGFPTVSETDWALEVCGLVDEPLTLSLSDLQKFPKVTLESVHQCAGSPVDTTKPMRQVANVVWGGADLSQVLASAGVGVAATHLWAYGLDHGVFGGEVHQHYVKDIPVERLAEGDVLVAYELNGEPLPDEHGFPARLVIPGYFGTNSVKWLARLELSDRRPDSVFTTTFYNDPTPDGSGRTPVWELAPESVIVSPGPDEDVGPGPVRVWGWAWSSVEVDRVEISSDNGSTWVSAQVEPRVGRSWQRFTFTWITKGVGPCVLSSRVTDADGRTQPADGARNAIHSVAVTVRPSS